MNKWNYRCVKWFPDLWKCDILHLLWKELSNGAKIIKIGQQLPDWQAKSKFQSPIYIYVVYNYDASDQKHGFLKFWTLDYENGVKWSWGTTLDDSPKKIPAFLHHSCVSCASWNDVFPINSLLWVHIYVRDICTSGIFLCFKKVVLWYQWKSDVWHFVWHILRMYLLCCDSSNWIT